MTLNVPQTRRPANAEQKALLALPPLMGLFPVVVGEYTWHRFSVFCAVCEGEIQPTDLHGRVDQTEPELALVEAIGLCRKCDVHSMALFSLNNEGKLLTSKDDGWSFKEPKTKFWSDLSKKLDL